MTTPRQRRNRITPARNSQVLLPEMQVEAPSDGVDLDETMQLSSPLPRADIPHMLMSPPPEEVLRVRHTSTR